MFIITTLMFNTYKKYQCKTLKYTDTTKPLYVDI